MALPRTVRLALYITLADYVVGLCRIGLKVTHQTSGQSAQYWVAVSVFVLIVYSILGFIWYKIYRARKWARISMAVLYVGGAVITMTSDHFMVTGVASSGSFWGHAVVQSIALALIFTPEANRWFSAAGCEAVD